MIYDQNLYQEVLQAHNASNASGLLTTWANKWRDAIWAELRQVQTPEERLASGISGSTDEFNAHPINVTVADKMLQLAGIYVNDDKLSAAYDALTARAAGKPEGTKA